MIVGRERVAFINNINVDFDVFKYGNTRYELVFQRIIEK